jgi:ribosomal protein S18 acetylase RimI-like enzyme
MIRRMILADIPAAMRLKESAGWNQTEQDWRNLLAIEPEGCWVYEAGQTPQAAGMVAGSTTIVCYGRDLAWIGMVLVLPEFRGQGIARQLMEHALRFAERRGVARVALDATAMGQPLYRQLGFEDETLIERWEGTAPLTDDREDGERPQAAGGAHLEQIADLDRQVFGADRRALMKRLMATAPADCWVAHGGYLLARPGSNAHFLGPCMAQEPQVALRLVRALFARHRGRRFFWDLLPGNRAARDLAASFGFQCARSLIRMSRPAVSAAARPQASWQYAVAGFEYG